MEKHIFHPPSWKLCWTCQKHGSVSSETILKFKLYVSYRIKYILLLLIILLLSSDLNQTEELHNLSMAFESSLEECSKDNTPEIKSRVVDIKNLLKPW